MSDRGHATQHTDPSRYGISFHVGPLHLLSMEYTDRTMDEREGCLVLSDLYMGNPKFTQGLAELADRHRSALEQYLQVTKGWEPHFREVTERVIRDKGDLNSIPPMWVHQMLKESRTLPEMQEYRQDLTDFRHDWNLKLRSPDNERLWNDLLHIKLLAHKSLIWPKGMEYGALHFLWEETDTISVEVSRFVVADRGIKEAFSGVFHQLLKDLHRPRSRREQSLTWLYLRLGEGIMPSEIALYYDDTESTVARLIKRDADLLGLQIPRGYPRGRKRGRATQRMERFL